MVPVAKVKKRKPPKTAAVAITSNLESIKYSDILTTAKNNINLDALGIEETRVKRAVTGGILVEILRDDGPHKADTLANQLQLLFRNNDAVNIARPTKKADMRLAGLDDSATVKEIKDTIAEIGGCAADDIRSGPVRMSPRGLGTIWLQCPLTMALKVMEKKRVRIGWTYVRPEILKQRTMHCFRYLEKGHVQQNCTNTIDRRSRCYNCGSTAHQVRTCTEKHRCPVCIDYGLPTNHRVGTEACKPPRQPGPKSRTVNNTITSKDSQEMEREFTQVAITSTMTILEAIISDATGADNTYIGDTAWEGAISIAPDHA